MEECCTHCEETLQYYKTQLKSLRIEWMYMQEKESLMSKIIENKDSRIRFLMSELQEIKNSLSSNRKKRRKSFNSDNDTTPEFKRRTIKIVRRSAKSPIHPCLNPIEMDTVETNIIYTP